MNNQNVIFRHHKKQKSKSSGQGVSFYIDEEEKEHLLTNKNPDISIVVDPPSQEHSENEEQDGKIWSSGITCIIPIQLTHPCRGLLSWMIPNNCDIIYFLGLIFIVVYIVQLYGWSLNLCCIYIYHVRDRSQNFPFCVKNRIVFEAPFIYFVFTWDLFVCLWVHLYIFCHLYVWNVILKVWNNNISTESIKIDF